MKKLFFFLLFAFFSVQIFCSPSVLYRNYVIDAEKRLSLCNDGTSPVFYINKKEKKTQWLIYLEGGGACYSIESCKKRYRDAKFLMTSDGYGETTTMYNIFDDSKIVNPAFFDSNFVYIHYCSSDWWSGNNTKNPTETGDFHFNGRNIVTSVVQDLLEFHGMNEAEQIVLFGTSAGGVGAWSNSDKIGNLVKELVPGVDYRVISDSGFFLDGKPYKEFDCTDPNFCSYGQRIKKGKKMWGLLPHEDCAEYFNEESHLCLVGYHVHSFVKSPKMSVHYNTDLWQTSQDGITNKKKISDITKKEEKEFVYQRGKFVTKMSEKLENVWMMGCFFHTNLPIGAYTQFSTNDGITPAQAIYDFVVLKNSTKHIDYCDELICNKKCPNN